MQRKGCRLFGRLIGGLAVLTLLATSAHAQSVQINFQPASAAVPSGYTADTGAPYGLQSNGATYGWLKTADDQPVDASSATRERGYFTDKRVDTFNHLQRGDCCTSGFTDEIYWQYELPNGTYDVTLAFGDEPNGSGEYDSQHQVDVEGTVVPASPFQATASEEFLITTVTVDVTDGILTIRPTADAFNAKLNFADIVPASSNNPVRLNAGGPNLITSLGDFSADTYHTGASQTSSKSFAVGGTDDDDLYLTYRYSDSGAPFGYAIPVDDGDYTVTLHFLEPYFGVTGPGGTGNRVFDVDIEGGQETLTSFDLNAIPDGGPQQAVVRTFSDVSVSDGTLNVDFTSSVNNAIISAIEVVPATGGGNTPPSVSSALSDVQVEQDAAPVVVSLAGVFTDAEDDDAALGLSVEGNTNSGLVTTSLGGTDLTLSFAAGQAGAADITVRATDAGGLFAEDTFTVTVTPPPSAFDVTVNFQSENAAVPSGTLRDFGQGYDLRTDADQGGGQYSYGWVVPGTSTPLSLVGNGRDRGQNPDQLLDTIMHMQGDDVEAANGSFNGVAEEGAWELAVPNGFYEVTVGLGDSNQPGGSSSVAEVYTLNVEGARAITNFEPAGASGTATRHTSATLVVEVTDGRLTLDATGDYFTANSKISHVGIQSTTALPAPHVTGTTPGSYAEDVDPSDASVAAALYLPASVTPNGVDLSTLTSQNVLLYPSTNPSAPVALNINDTGGQDAIVSTPLADLQPETWYTFEVTAGVQDLAGDAFLPTTMSFKTGQDDGGGPGPVEFTKTVVNDPADDEKYTSLVIGPDGKLYALIQDGRIRRWTVNADGTLASEETLGAVQAAQGSRLAIGLVFDPAATAGNLVAYVSHTQFVLSNGDDWEGKVSRLTGADLGTVEDLVVGLPRSTKDHVTNSLAFGPDGALYVNQGSNTAMGAPDNTWGNRPERYLSAAVLRIDVGAISTLPLDVQTEEGGSYAAQAYDPNGPNPPVTVYAAGLRNAYDLAWHSNGYLYVPTNGSGAGGNAPAGPGDDPPALFGLPTQPDFLFKIPAPTSYTYSYYGHPNPTHGEYVLNGGNPTAGSDPAEVSQYPVGTQTDPNYAGFAYDFGNNKSPNGVVEYLSNAFGGALQGKLLVARFSGGDDLIVLTPGTGGDISEATTGYPGLTGFDDPIDLVENTANGDLYVSEYDRGGQNHKITLLRPVDPGSGTPTLAANKSELIWSGFVAATKPDAAIDLILSNTGSGQLDVTSLSVSGADAGAFSVSPASLNLSAGQAATVAVTFDPSSTGPKEAQLDVASSAGTLTVPLYALASQDWEGSGEPPLAHIVQTLGYDVDVGFTTLASDGNSFPIGDEVLVDLFQKAGSGPVEIVPVARYAPEFAVPFGWYEPVPGGTPPDASDLNTVGTLSEKPATGSDLDNPHHQMLFPPLQGGSTTFEPVVLTFDPGASTVFGLFSQSPDNTGYTEDAINPPTNSGSQHRVRAYPLKDRSGALVPNSYLVGFEEAHNHDHNDYVFVVSNVQPAAVDGVLASSDDAVDFGAVTVDATGAYTLTLSNAGSTDINLASIDLTGDAAFSLLTSPLPTVVASGSSADLELAFAPAATGSFSGTLSITHDGTNTPLTVDLSGAGVAPSSALARLNVGGAAYTDMAGNAWDADDTSLITGQTSFNDTDVYDVQGTDDDDLFATRRWGTDFTYEIPLPAGTYDVKLYFAEPYWGRPGTGGANGGAGDRLFDVTIEGDLALDDYDLFADGGDWGIAVVKTHADVAVSDGALTLEFDVVPDKNNAIVSAIEVLPAASVGDTDFAAQLTVSELNQTPVDLEFGTAPTATGGTDAGLDALLPPLPPPDGFAARFTCSAGNGACEDALSKDYRATISQGETITWTVSFQRDDPQADITFSWDVAQLPAGSVRLVDDVTGTVVNVDMKAQASYTLATTGLDKLLIVYSETSTVELTVMDGWNMVGLPLSVADANYQIVFDGTQENSLYRFNGSYEQVNTLEHGEGYWLNFNQAGVQSIEGTVVSPMDVDLQAGWNMVSGPGCDIERSTIGGSAILDSTPFYGFAGAYDATTTLVPGKGYWVKANTAGTITLDCSAAPPPAKGNVPPSLADAGRDDDRLGVLVLRDGRASQRLYFGASADQPRAAFAVPPLPPQGIFDARFEGDSRLSEVAESQILLQRSGGALSVRIERLPQGSHEGAHVLEEILGGRVIATHALQAGTSVEVTRADVAQLRLRATHDASLPETFALQGNFPNPFHTATQLVFDVPEDAEVEVEVYDMLGRVVLKVPGQSVAAGSAQKVRLDVAHLASGTYLYRVSARMGSRSATQTGHLTLLN